MQPNADVRIGDRALQIGQEELYVRRQFVQGPRRLGVHAVAGIAQPFRQRQDDAAIAEAEIADDAGGLFADVAVPVPQGVEQHVERFRTDLAEGGDRLTALDRRVVPNGRHRPEAAEAGHDLAQHRAVVTFHRFHEDGNRGLTHFCQGVGGDILEAALGIEKLGPQ